MKLPFQVADTADAADADMCETFQDGSGKKVRGRSYPWGTVSLKIIELSLVNLERRDCLCSSHCH